MIMVIGINVQLFASSFECSGGLIECSSSFGNMWILVFSLLPCVCCVCVCVCVLQCLNYLTLRSCLFLSLPYTHICIAVCVTLLFAFQFTLQPCFCFEKSDLGRNSNHLQSENFICLIGRCGCSSESSRTFCRSASRTVQRLMQQSKNLEIRVRFYH